MVCGRPPEYKNINEPTVYRQEEIIIAQKKYALHRLTLLQLAEKLGNGLEVTRRHVRDRMVMGLRRIFGLDNWDNAWNTCVAMVGEFSVRATRYS